MKITRRYNLGDIRGPVQKGEKGVRKRVTVTCCYRQLTVRPTWNFSLSQKPGRHRPHHRNRPLLPHPNAFRSQRTFYIPFNFTSLTPDSESSLRAQIASKASIFIPRNPGYSPAYTMALLTSTTMRQVPLSRLSRSQKYLFAVSNL